MKTLTYTLIALLLLLPLFSACTTNATHYKAADITSLAKSVSPDCPAPSEGHCG